MFFIVFPLSSSIQPQLWQWSSLARWEIVALWPLESEIGADQIQELQSSRCEEAGGPRRLVTLDGELPWLAMMSPIPIRLVLYYLASITIHVFPRRIVLKQLPLTVTFRQTRKTHHMIPYIIIDLSPRVSPWVFHIFLEVYTRVK